MVKCRRVKRPQFVKELDILDNKNSSRIRQESYRQDSFATNTDTHTSGSPVKNHISLENGIRILCNTENFVPIVVPGFISGNVLEDPLAPDEISSAPLWKFEEYGISFLRICTCGYWKNCWASWCLGKRPSEFCNSHTEICKEVSNLESILSCRGGTFSSKLHNWVAEESNFRFAFR